MKRGIEKSMVMQERARRRIPGMTQLLSKRPDMFTYGVWPGYYAKASGVRVWDLDGNEYLDMSISGIGANILGYADPDVDNAVRRAVADGVSCSLNCPEEVELAELLCELHPWADMVRYAKTGGEAMAVAVRIARAATGCDVVAFCGYHGWHDWYLAANLAEDDALDGHLLPGLSPNGVPRSLAGSARPFRFNRLEDLESIADETGGSLAAVVLEPIRNDPPDPAFAHGVRTLAEKCGAVLILDEISAGFRLTTGGAHLVLDMPDPDVAVFSKALGNGYPVAAVIGREEVMAAAQNTFISSTNWTERIGPAAALATIRKHRRTNAAAHVCELGRAMQEGWAKLGRENGLDLDVGGIPPLSHFAFSHVLGREGKALFIQMMLERGVMASTLFYPMLAHTMEDVRRYLDEAATVFPVVARGFDEGSIGDLLEGTPANVGFTRLN